MWSAQQASAQGIALTPGWYDWTGVYVGINAGYGTTASTQAFSGVVAGGQLVRTCSIKTLFSASKSTATGRRNKGVLEHPH
jgi:hypothetical protein